MSARAPSKLRESAEALDYALTHYAQGDEPEAYRLAALAKSFEVAVEYAWKELKYYVEAEGLDAPSPKEAVRKAARLNVLDDAALWLNFINARNASVHDYFELTTEGFVRLAGSLLREVNALLSKIG